MKTAQVELDVTLQYNYSQSLGAVDDDFVLPVDGVIYGETNEASRIQKVKLGDLKMYLVQVGNSMNADMPEMNNQQFLLRVFFIKP